MTNKTLHRGIVQPASSLSPIAEHALVIVDEKGGGARHVQTVKPGEKFKLPLFGREHLAGYHVTLDDRLRHAFVTRHQHEDAVHGFSLECTLSFRVLRDSPQLVALRLAEDPLGKLEEEAVRVLPGPVRRMPWAELTQKPDVTGVAVNGTTLDDNGERAVNLDRLRVYARLFGLDLRQVEVTRHLDDVDVAVARESAELEREKGKRDVQMGRMLDQQREDELRIELEKRLEVQKAASDTEVGFSKLPLDYVSGMRESIGTIASSSRNLNDVRVQLEQLRHIKGLTGNVLPGVAGGNGGLSLGSASEPPVLMLADPAAPPPSTIRGMLASACEIASVLSCSPEQQERFLGAMLRVFAARLGREAPEELERARSHLADLHRRHAQDMQEAHSEFVLRLMQPTDSRASEGT